MRYKRKELISYIIKFEDCLNITNGNKKVSPLHAGLTFRHMDYKYYEKLLNFSKNDPDFKDFNGKTFIHHISTMISKPNSHIFIPLLKLVLSKGANPNFYDSNLKSPLYIATERNNFPMLGFAVGWNRMVINNQQPNSKIFDFNIRNTNKGLSCLHKACSKPNLSLITEITRDLGTKAYILDNSHLIPRYCIQKSYLTSRKMVLGLERVQLIVHFKSNCFFL